jgi:hypothetical protein
MGNLSTGRVALAASSARANALPEVLVTIQYAPTPNIV